MHLYADNSGRFYERQHGWARTAQADEQLAYVLGCRHSGDPTLAKLAELSQKASEWLEKNQRYLELIQSLGELHKDQEEWMQNFPNEYAEAQSIVQGTPGAQPAASRKKRKRGP